MQETSDDSARGHQTIVKLQKELHLEQANVQQWKTKCEKWNQEIDRWKSQCALLEIEVSKLKEKSNELAEKLNKIKTNFELECYRAEAKVRKQCEAHEKWLLQQLNELQHQRKEVKEEKVIIGTAVKTAVHQKDMKNSACIPAMDQQNLPGSPTEYQEPTKGIQWFGLDRTPKEEPTPAMVSETSVYGWKSLTYIICL